MSHFIDDLLNYSRVSTDPQPFKPINLNEIIKLVLTDLEVIIQKTQASITIDKLPVIEANQRQIYQMFLNLLANSLKFIQAKSPRIDVTCKKGNDNFWEIQIKDNGIGLSNEYKEKIFEPFFRLHRRNEYEGAGTGLAICKKLIEQHNGTISAEGEPGKGATFTIRLPEKN